MAGENFEMSRAHVHATKSRSGGRFQARWTDLDPVMPSRRN